MKFSGKMRLMIIQKAIKKLGFTLSLDDTFFKKKTKEFFRVNELANCIALHEPSKKLKIFENTSKTSWNETRINATVTFPVTFLETKKCTKKQWKKEAILISQNKFYFQTFNLYFTWDNRLMLLGSVIAILLSHEISLLETSIWLMINCTGLLIFKLNTANF